MAKIIIPFPLRKFTDDLREVAVDGSTLDDCIANLIGRYPQMKTIHDQSALLSIFVNGKQNRDPWGHVQLENNDEISLIIPIAGG